MNIYQKNFYKSMENISFYYSYLVDLTKKHYYIGQTNEWVIDNYYLILEQEKNTTRFLKDTKSYQQAFNKSIDLYTVMRRILKKNNFKIDSETLIQELNIYQNDAHRYFSYGELGVLGETAYLVLIDELASLCRRQYQSLQDELEVKSLIETIKRDIDQYHQVNLQDYLTLSEEIAQRPVYLERLNAGLQELGQISTDVFKQLNERLDQKGIQLNEIAGYVHTMKAEETILVSNIFSSIVTISKLSIEDLYHKSSKTEQILLMDFYYPQMTIETKRFYRDRIIKNAKKNKKSEYDYARDILSLAKNENRHFGEYLQKKENLKYRSAIYVGLVVLFTTVLSFFLSKYFINLRILGFFLLWIPACEVVVKILNRIYQKIYKPEPIPKLDFSKGIPESSATMAVVVTILKDTDKVDTMFNSLESYYLSNKSDNLYFTLLGDCSSSDHQIEPFDDEILEAGLKKSEELNKKYGKEIFYFIYRKRIYNDSEEAWLGYERKRGALEHFNRLLLGKLSLEEQQTYYTGHNFSNFDKKIKYVIPLDQDTLLVLGSALKMVGAMSHPLNRPIFNEKHTKIVQGYGVMQPKMVNIHSVNKSLFARIYAGTSGPFYQNVFKESPFGGKGIYDLAVFDEILTGLFPENLILSHDNLEGYHVRGGLLTDVEAFEDYPLNLLEEAKRRHRWCRGDMQTALYLHMKKNPLNLVERWNSFEKIKKGLLDASLLIILFCSLLIGIVNPIWWILFSVLVLGLPIIFYIIDYLKISNKDSSKIKKAKGTMSDFNALCIKTFANFCSIPYNAKIYIDAFTKAWYRTYISHKHLLAWVTADEASKKSKNKFSSYVKSFGINYLLSALLVLLVCFFKRENLIFALILGILFSASTIIFYILGKDINQGSKNLSIKEVNSLYEIGKDTWKFFEQFLTEENHYLIPDNYQLNRASKEDMRTSPTNIGFSIMAVISASEMKFITNEEAISRIEKVIESVEKLEKWHGHLYNWYNIKTLEKMSPSNISTSDSGNFVASLMVAESFVYKYGNLKLRNRIENLIQQTNFQYLLNSENQLLSYGYDNDNKKLNPDYYQYFANESRLTSFVAVAKGDIDKKHWFSLDKTLVEYQERKGLMSWSGSLSEYYMPFIWMKSYPNTLMDESYSFAYYCQRKYVSNLDSSLPWGISGAAYNLLDNSQNYKYAIFGTPYLKFRYEKEDRVVLSPYSSVLTIEKYPREVYENLQKFLKLNMYGEYGFYESYDYGDKVPIFSYFAQHQGMILCSLANYLCNDAIQNYFYEDVRVQAFDLLNEEQAPIKSVIDLKPTKYNRPDYEREIFENDIREYSYISQRPEISILSNSNYCLLLNDRGTGFSRYKTIQMNRYREITEQEYGNFLYIRDLDNNKVWSNTYAPTNVKPDRYHVVFSLDRIKYMRIDSDIVTNTEIIVTKPHNAEIRKITFRNVSSQTKRLELTTYTEPILYDRNGDIGHRVFNGMFMKSFYHEETNSLILHRRIRATRDKYYMVSKLLISSPINSYSYETERTNFIKRGTDYHNPSGLYTELTNYVGENLDPISSIRNGIEIPANQEVTVYMINGFGKSREQVLEIAEAYHNEASIEEAFSLSTIMVNDATKKLGVMGNDVRLYNMTLNYLYQTNRIHLTEERKQLLSTNHLDQTTLWSFGISGDNPIILVEIHDVSSVSLVQELLKAFEYYKSKCIFIDLVIINSNNERNAKAISKIIDDELYHMYAMNSFSDTPGRVVVIEKHKINEDQINLFRGIARLKFDTDYNSSLREHIGQLQQENSMSDYKDREILYSENTNDQEILMYTNEYGGFTQDGKEYHITNPNTPMPWSNVLTNGHFGTIITNNDNGFTYADNSKEYRITSWTNDTIIDDKSEGICINNQYINWYDCIHGIGYSKFKFKGKDYKIDVTYFVPPEDNLKIGLFTLQNISENDLNLDICYWINPVLGESEEKTVRNLVCNYNEPNNFLTIQNKCSVHFKDNIVYMTSTNNIKHVEMDSVMSKNIHIQEQIEKNGTITFAFLLGCEKNLEKVQKTIKLYQDISFVQKKLEETIFWWNKKIGVVQVKTNDPSFDFMINYWYLYQTFASRIMAKAGFYQVSGAFGFRDQLQDSMNVGMIDSRIAKQQILMCAKHQFREGDVLHWWHVENHFGLRARYKDDYLWLVYATLDYLRNTGDAGILDERVPFVEGDALYSDEQDRGIIFTYSEDTASLYEHLVLTMDKLSREIGENGLPLIGGGDWNDGMNRVGIQGKGTSVWLGFFAYEVVNRFMKIASKYKYEDVSKYEEFRERLKIALQKYGWDGEYYLRAYFDNGDKLGSHENEECKIDLISQSWAILTEIASQDQLKHIIRSVEENLVDDEHKLIKLLTPSFSNPKNNPGYIKDYSVGIRENGGQYTHSVAWWIMALLKLGLNGRAYYCYQMMNPIHHTFNKQITDEYKVEPYVIAADIYSNPYFIGHGGWTWYTGSSGWFYHVALVNILGFNKVGNRLYILPSIPIEWETYQIIYHYEETVYEITVNNHRDDNEIRVDGELVQEIRLVNDRKVHNVNVNIGNRGVR